MRKITKLLAAISIIATSLVILHIYLPVTMGRTPSIKPSPASFEVQSLAFTVSNDEIVEIKARVRNTGQTDGSYTATLLVDGCQLSSKTIDVTPDTTETIQFDCCVSRNNGYVVELDRFYIPVDQLTAIKTSDPQVFTVGGDGIIEDNWHQQQIVYLPTMEFSSNGGGIARVYNWLFAGTKWVWEIRVPESLYNYFKGLKRPSGNDYSVYIKNTADDLFIEELASELAGYAQGNGYNRLETVQYVAAFVQGLPYTSDLETTGSHDYQRYPVETLVDFGGDCEDTAILLAALLEAMGHDVILLAYPGHYAIGVLGDENTYGVFWEYDGKEYFYLETSIGGWKIGEIPEHLIDAPAVIYALD